MTRAERPREARPDLSWPHQGRPKKRLNDEVNDQSLAIHNQ